MGECLIVRRGGGGGSEPTLVYSNVQNASGTGSATITDTYTISDSAKYLIVCSCSDGQQNSFYDGTTSTLKLGTTDIGNLLESADKSGDDPFTKLNTRYAITDGTNGTITFTANGVTFSTYKMELAATMLVYKL